MLIILHFYVKHKLVTFLHLIQISNYFIFNNLFKLLMFFFFVQYSSAKTNPNVCNVNMYATIFIIIVMFLSSYFDVRKRFFPKCYNYILPFYVKLFKLLITNMNIFYLCIHFSCNNILYLGNSIIF